MASLDDFQTAIQFQTVVRNMIKEELQAQSLGYKYAEVISIDPQNRKAVVKYSDIAGDVATVNTGVITPLSAGQVVRVDGKAGDRYITDVTSDGSAINANTIFVDKISPRGQDVGIALPEMYHSVTYIRSAPTFPAPNATWTDIAWTGSDSNGLNEPLGTGLATPASVFTVPWPGYWHVSATVSTDTAAAGGLALRILTAAGSVVAIGPNSYADLIAPITTLTATFWLNTSFKIQINQTSGSTRTVQINSGATPCACRIMSVFGTRNVV